MEDKHIGERVRRDGKSVPTDPDPDWHQLFCASGIGKPHCQAGRIRALHIEEPESLGPYMARFFASKLWNGEEWYMQIDSHMTYHQDWDDISIKGLNKAPSKKPVSGLSVGTVLFSTLPLRGRPHSPLLCPVSQKDSQSLPSGPYSRFSQV